MLLVKEGNYALSDINGEERVVEGTRPPTLAERAEEASVWRPAWYAAVGAVALGVVTSSTLVGLAVAAIVFAGLAASAVANADAPPRKTVEKVSSPGMGEAEVWRRMVALDELMQMRNEEVEDEQKKAQRQQGNLPGV